MEILQLQYFKKIAELEHITKAAEELMVSQPALSKTIKHLENELDIKLFDRSGKNIILNENGKVLLKYSNKILSLLDDMKNELIDMNKKEFLTVRVCMNAATRLLPDLILDFKKKYPEIRISIVQKDITENIKNEFDICIDSSRYPIQNNNTLTLLKEECFIGLPKEHRLANKNKISLDELKDEKFIIIQNKKPLSEITNDFCKNAGFKPNVVLECDSRRTTFALIEVGMGIAFIPEITWNISENNSISFIHVDGSDCSRYINISWKSNGYLSNSARLFKDFVIEYFKRLTKDKNH